MKLHDTFTKNAQICIKHANTLAIANNQRTINGDNLFWGTYAYLRQHKYGDIFFNVTWIQQYLGTLDSYFDDNYRDSIESIFFGEKKRIPFNKKLSAEIYKVVNVQDTKFDFLFLFWLSFQDLASETVFYLKANDIESKTLRNNSEKLLFSKPIRKTGVLAFLEILDKMFRKLHLDPKNVKIMQIEKMDTMNDINMMLDAVESDIADNSKSWSKTSTSDKDEEKKLTIEYFGTDLTKEFVDGYLDPVIWREQEINQMIYTLLRKTKNNPLLIGEAGVGKTAIVEWLAQKIVKWEVPEKLQNKRIFMLDMGTLLAWTKYRGEFESRMKQILEEAMDPTNHIILFIDELHTIIGAGGQDNNDAAQMIKPLLARGKVKLIGATTFDEYQKHIEKDAALKRRFQEVVVNEPDVDTTQQIMEGLQETYEDFHGVKLNSETINLAIKLSKRYILNKHLPDKALDIIDEACARKSTMSQKLENDDGYKKSEIKIKKVEKEIEQAIDSQDYFKAAELKEKQEKLKKDMLNIRNSKNIPMHLRPEINKNDIGSVISEKLWVPASIVTESEVDKLKRLNNDLNEKIIGQDEAVQAIVKSLTRNRLSVIEKNKPIGSFLFLGPTGVGKTYLAKLIAKDYFGDEKSLIRVDMSEFMEKYSVSKLIWSPAGYVGYDEGGSFTEQVRRKPYSVILLDEIEKAAPDVLNILLQMLDEGQLKDSKWRIIDFKSTIIIMTSNLGAEEFSKKQAAIGFANHDDIKQIDKDFDQTKARVMEHVKDFLSPELLNRIDNVTIFKPLTKEVLTSIMDIKIKEFLAAWKQEASLKMPRFTKQKITKIIDDIYDPGLGARPLDRYINDKIEPQLIEQMMK